MTHHCLYSKGTDKTQFGNFGYTILHTTRTEFDTFLNVFECGYKQQKQYIEEIKKYKVLAINMQEFQNLLILREIHMEIWTYVRMFLFHAVIWKYSYQK